MSPLKLSMSVIGAICVLKEACVGYLFNTKQTIQMDQVVNGRLVFNTTIISSCEDCVEECEAVTSCRLVNYRRHGQICELVHYSRHGFDMDMVLSQNQTAGFVSWTKIGNPNTTASRNWADQSCKPNAELGTCEIYACRKPPYMARMDILGNIYTVKSKLMYRCPDHISQTSDHGLEIICRTDGRWRKFNEVNGSNISIRDFTMMCNMVWIQDEVTNRYSRCFMPDGTSFMFKIYKEEKNKYDAEMHCDDEGARLVSFLTAGKRRFFEEITNQVAGDFWIDAKREASNETWVTSNGKIVPTDSDLWVEGETYTDSQWCARVNIDTLKMQDIYCSYTNHYFYYICEKSDAGG